MNPLSLIMDWLAPKLGTTPLIIGLAGAQGSGKSTVAANLVSALSAAGIAAAAVSLDDFYLPKACRLALARRVHPLLATRGVPGTHHVPLLLDVLLRIRSGRPVSVPVFDKLADDRLPPQHWRRFNRIDVLILEGWCVGARPQPAALLTKPVNALEASEDPHALWRTHVNQALAGNYQRAWALLDALAFLAAPAWATVPRWRAEQEAALTRATRRPGMDPVALVRFCAHYERLTRWQLASTPRHASLTLQLDGKRRVIGQAPRA